jgi:hypothetical protein
MYKSKDTNEAEIKNLFLFLAGKEDDPQREKAKISELIYGIENFGFNLGVEKIRNVKSQLEKIGKKNTDGYISYEDFRQIWFMADMLDKDRLSTKDLSNQVFRLMEELITERNTPDTNNKTTMTTEGNIPDSNRKIMKYELASLLKQLDIGDSHDVEKYSRRGAVVPGIFGRIVNVDSKPDADTYENMADDMIKCINMEDGDDFTLKDFECVIEHYLNNLK